MKQATTDRLLNNGAATGVVIWKGRALGISIPAPFLALDLISWTTEVRVKLEETADLCDKEGEAGAAAEYRCESQKLSFWLDSNKTEPIWEHPALHIRQSMEPLQVTKSNIVQYLGELFLRAERPESGATNMFLLVIDSDIPILFTTKRLRFAAQHTGHEIQGLVVTEQELAEKIHNARKGVEDLNSRASVDRPTVQVQPQKQSIAVHAAA